MNYKNIPSNYPIKAQLCTAENVCVRPVPGDLAQEAVEYAALRFLARDARLFHYYASESCKPVKKIDFLIWASANTPSMNAVT